MITHRLSATLIALALLAAGCATEPHMAPTPAIIKDSRLAFARTLPPELHSTHVPVFFATTRAAVTGPEHFGNDAAEGVALGFADVRLGEPGWTWDDLLASNQTSSVDKARIGAVESVKIFGSASAEGATSEAIAHCVAIDAQLARIRNQNLVVYVHGYWVTFDEVAADNRSPIPGQGHRDVPAAHRPMFWNRH
jgi:esterase/lipase superfamily enzyme